MASLESTGSPPSRGTIAGHFTIHEEEEGNPSTAGATQQLDLVSRCKLSIWYHYSPFSQTRTVSTGGSTPLTSSKLGNIQAKPALDIGGKKVCLHPMNSIRVLTTIMLTISSLLSLGVPTLERIWSASFDLTILQRLIRWNSKPIS